MTETPPSSDQTRSGVDRATVLAEDLIDRGAPWSAKTSWTIVLVEGIVAAILGLLFLVEPFGGSTTTLTLTGLVLLVAALVTAFQLWRGHIRPDLRELMAFRAGSGVTVGLVIVVAAIGTNVTDTVIASLSAVVGIGFIVFGLVGILSSFVRRMNDAPLPLATLVVNAVLGFTGLVLLFAGIDGADSVDTMFNLLGVLLVAVGLGLAGYSYMLYQRENGRT